MKARIFALVSLLGSASAGAGTWTVTSEEGAPGETVVVELSFSGATTVEAQADLGYNPALLTATPTGVNGGACTVTSVGFGKLRVLTTYSGSLLETPTVYCSVSFAIAAAAPSPTTAFLTFSNLVCADEQGDSTTCTDSPGTVAIDTAAPTTTTLSVLPAPPFVVNTPATVTAQVDGASPSGTVAFSSDLGAIPSCTAVPLTGSGNSRTAACETTTLRVGARSLTASYSGDAANEASTSAGFPAAVFAPTIVLSPTNLPAANAGVPYDVPIVPEGAGSASPFQFAVVSGSLPPGLALEADGSIAGTPLLVTNSSFTIRATDSSAVAVGGPFTGERAYSLDVTAQPTTTSVASITPSPAVVSMPYTVAVTVTSAVGTPTGSVTIGDGLGASCTATLDNGGGACALATAAAGARTITASYGGQNTFAASSGARALTVLSSAQVNATVSAADRIGQRDRIVTVPISIRGDGSTVKFSARVAFDPAQFQDVALHPVAPASCTRIAPNLIEVNTLGSSRTLPLPAVETPFCDVTFRLVTTPSPSIDLSIDPATTTCQDGSGSSSPCKTRDGRILVSSIVTQPGDGTQVNIAGYQGAASETRVLIVSNVGTAPVTITNCQVTGTGFSLAAAPVSDIAPGGSSRILVGCTLSSFPETRQGGLLQCATSDAVRSTLSFGLACTTVPEGSQLPGDQVFNNSLKQGDEFGRSTALSDVGGSSAGPAAGSKGAADATQLMVVGAPNAGSDSAGRVFIFEGDLSPKALGRHSKDAKPRGLAARVGLGAMRLARVVEPPRGRGSKLSIGDKFGSAVAISPSGTRIAVGAPLGGNGDRGQVLIYDRPDGGWGELDVDDILATIDAPPSDGLVSAQEFGGRLAFTPNGDLVVGAPGTDSISSQNIGAIYFYQAEGAGYAANPQRSGSPNAVANGRFGDAIAADGSTIVIGAPQEGAANSQSGAAYLLRISNGLPTAPERFLPASAGIGDKFGSAVAIGANGIVVVGASGDDAAGTDSGSATVFRAIASDAPIEVATLVPEPGENQGAGMSVATNGDLIVLGAPRAALGGNEREGRAYLFDVEPQFATARNLPARPSLDVLRNFDSEAGAEFGHAVAINRAIAVAGVPLDDRLIDTLSASDVGRVDPFALERIFRSDFE
jgi:hypothetical protein